MFIRKILILIAVSCAVALPNLTWAHSEKAHVHGSGSVSLAFDSTKGKLQFESPADSTVGFEHTIKTKSDQKKVDDTLALIKSQMAEMIHFSPELKCTFSPAEVQFEIEKTSGHAETHSEFDINCAKSPKGSTLTFNFKKIFPKLKTVDVQIIVDDLQKSLKVETEAAQVDLK